MGNLADEINNKIMTEGFTQTVTRETHFGFGSNSLIDLSWNNCTRQHLETLNLSSQFDHNVIMTRMSCKFLDNNNIPRKGKILKNYSVTALRKN